MSLTLRHVKAGTRLPTLRKVTTDEQLRLLYQRTLLLAKGISDEFEKYSDGPNIHTDDTAARAAGFNGRVVTGHHIFSFLSEMLSLFFGIGWVEGGKIKIKFVRPLLMSEEALCEGEVKKISPCETKGEGRAKLAVWCKNARGETVATGTAEARVLFDTAS